MHQVGLSTLFRQVGPIIKIFIVSNMQLQMIDLYLQAAKISLKYIYCE